MAFLFHLFFLSLSCRLIALITFLAAQSTLDSSWSLFSHYQHTYLNTFNEIVPPIDSVMDATSLLALPSSPAPSGLQIFAIFINFFFPALALIVVSIRAAGRFATGRFGWDDWLVCIAMVLSVGETIISFFCTLTDYTLRYPESCSLSLTIDIYSYKNQLHRHPARADPSARPNPRSDLGLRSANPLQPHPSPGQVFRLDLLVSTVRTERWCPQVCRMAQRGQYRADGRCVFGNHIAVSACGV